MALLVPTLDIQQHQVDGLEVGVREAVAEMTVGVQCGVNTHGFCRGEEFEHELVLHQWLAPADSESASHDLEPVLVFAQFIDCLRDRHRYAVGEGPRVWIMAVQAAELAAREPRYDTDTRPVDGRSSRERVDEADIAGSNRRPDIRLGNVAAEIHSEFERALRRQRNLLRLICALMSGAMESPVDDVHLLLAAQPHEVNRVT